MDEKRYLYRQIKDCKRKLNIAHFLDTGVCFLAFGGVAAIVAEAVSLLYPFYYVHWFAIGAVVFSLFAGIIRAFWNRKNMRDAAGKLDSFGLKERILTAYEHLEEESHLAKLLRTDAAKRLSEIQAQVKISVLPCRRHLIAFSLSVLCAIALAFVPSQARELAKEQHAIRVEAKEEEKKVRELVKKIEEIDTAGMTEEQMAELQEMIDSMELSMEELKNVTSKEALAAAQQKLDYKYGQTAAGLSSLAAQLTDPSKAGIADAEAMAKAAANENPQTASSEGGSAGGSGENGDGDGSGNGDGNGDGNGNGDGDGNGDGNRDGNGDENGNGNGNGNGDGNGDGNGKGDGNGNGDGDGNGDGNGNGNGNGKGGGNGNGRGEGSSSAAHDYVSVPNSVGDDDSISGKKDGNDNSDYYRAENGLAWEGDHVSLDSVIGEYTKDAYEGIANGKYPSGMEEVIKDYFQTLND